MLQSAPRQDFKRTVDGNAISERIAEWLATPEGSVAHDPSWGHNLGKFKFEPLSQNGDLEVRIELSLTRKLPIDIEELVILAVHVDVLDIDLCRITIVHQYGVDTQTTDL